MSKEIKPARGAGPNVVRRRAPRQWTGKRRQLFLTALGEMANVRKAAAVADMSLTSAYNLKNRDADFAAAWREALEIGYSEVEMTLLRQSLEGSERVETRHDGEARTLRYTKTVHSFNFPVAVRLFAAHREEVLAYRLERERQREVTAHEGAAERARGYLTDIRARLLAAESGEPGGEYPREDGAVARETE